MRKLLAVVVAAASIMVVTGLAFAAGAPVALTQTLTGYSKSGNTVTLEYAVQVRNQQDLVFNSLALTLVPNPLVGMAKRSFTIDRLGPKAVADLKVKVVTPLLRDQEYFTRMPLAWAAKYTDASGNTSEFPIKSSTGGAK